MSLPSLVPPVFHAILVHAPLVLLPVAAVLSLFARRWPWMRDASRVLLTLGAIGALTAVVSGYVEKDAAVEEWDGTAKASWIKVHQVLGFVTAGLAATLAGLAWIPALGFLRRAAPVWMALLVVTGGSVAATGWYGGAIVWEDLPPVEFDRSGFGSSTTTSGSGGASSTGNATSISSTGTTPSTTTTQTGSSTQSTTSSTTAPPPSGSYTGQETGQSNAQGLPIWEVFVETNADTGSYGFSLDPIVVPTNHEIRLHYGNFDVENRAHDVVIGEGGSIAKTGKLNAGQTSTTTFTVNGALQVPFYCSVGNHREHGMEGVFIVQ